MALPKINLNKKQKILASIAVLMAGVFLVERVVFSGMRSKSKKISQQIKLAESMLEKDLSLHGSKDKLIAEYNKYQVYFKAKEFNSEQLMAEFLKEIERLAKDSAVSVVSFSPQAVPEDTRGSVRYKADLRLEANYNQALIFMQKIQESKLLIALDKVSFVPKDERASILKLDIVASMAVP